MHGVLDILQITVLALVVCEEGGRGLVTHQSSKWGDCKRESQPGKGERGRGGIFPITGLPLDVPGKSLFMSSCKKGINSHFPRTIVGWEVWGNGERAQVLIPEASQRSPVHSPRLPQLPSTWGCPFKGLVYENWNVSHWTGLWDSRYPSVPVSESLQFFFPALQERESRSSLTTLLALSF